MGASSNLRQTKGIEEGWDRGTRAGGARGNEVRVAWFAPGTSASEIKSMVSPSSSMHSSASGHDLLMHLKRRAYFREPQ